MGRALPVSDLSADMKTWASKKKKSTRNRAITSGIWVHLAYLAADTEDNSINNIVESIQNNKGANVDY